MKWVKVNYEKSIPEFEQEFQPLIGSRKLFVVNSISLNKFFVILK